MKYAVLVETAPVFALWIAPFLALGITISVVLELLACSTIYASPRTSLA